MPARSLMVSHWPVNSDAAVRLTTATIDALATEPAIGRAEALRRAMVMEIARGGHHADPANWAPFVLVGADR
jgi:CHAT domain-containing protein